MTAEEYYWYKGKQSGFPDCCIKHFVENVDSSYWKTYLIYVEAMHIMGDYTNHKPGYIPCPNCLKENRKL